MLWPQAKAAAKESLDGANISDAEVMNWADVIRRERRETAPWHYVNIPVDDPKGFDRARDGRNGDNVIDAIDWQVKVDKTQPREKRVESLKFVIHFAGDLHQPLHCAKRNRDNGGNGQHALQQLGRPNEAAERYRQAVEMAPAFVDAWNNLGVLLTEMERLEEACECFRRALAADPGNPMTRNLDDTLTDMGHNAEALPHWKASDPPATPDRSELTRSTCE